MCCFWVVRCNHKTLLKSFIKGIVFVYNTFHHHFRMKVGTACTHVCVYAQLGIVFDILRYMRQLRLTHTRCDDPLMLLVWVWVLALKTQNNHVFRMRLVVFAVFTYKTSMPGLENWPFVQAIIAISFFTLHT